MKKILAAAASVCIIVVIVIMIAMPSQAVRYGGPSTLVMTSSIPDSISKIIERSCFPCHSEPGKAMAMAKLNFDKWETYPPEKQADKARKMFKKLSKGSMPPGSFRENNPDKVPTESDVRIIGNWANSFPVK